MSPIFLVGILLRFGVVVGSASSMNGKKFSSDNKHGFERRGLTSNANQMESFEFGKYLELCGKHFRANLTTSGWLDDNIQETIGKLQTIEKCNIRLIGSLKNSEFPMMFPKDDLCRILRNDSGKDMLAFKSLIQTNRPVCWTDEKPRMDVFAGVVLAVVSGILAFVLLSTCCFWCHKRRIKRDSIRKKNNRKNEYLVYDDESMENENTFIGAFSCHENIKLWRSPSVNERHIKCLDGIRFLTICWFILLLTFILCPIKYTQELIRGYPRWSMYLILCAHFASDTFLTVSGLLLSYNTLYALENKKSIIRPFFSRLLRFLPAYTVVVFTSGGIVPFLRENSYNLQENAINCREHWWTNLLFINNIVHSKPSSICHQETWYLAADMQFFVVSLVITYILWKIAHLGLALIFALVVGAIACPTALTAVDDLIPSPVKLFYQTLTPEEVDEYVDFYIKPWNRAGPYLIGLLAGYYLNSKSKSQKPVSNSRFAASFAVVGWTISTIIGLALIYGLHITYASDEVVSKTESAIYGGVHSVGWSLIIVWIIIACNQGWGGWINEFLAWSVFTPLARLTYCIFLVSTNVQLVFNLFHYQSVSDPVPTTLTMTGYFFAHLTASLIVAFLLHIIVQLPFIQMGNAVVRPSKGSSEEEDLRKRPRKERYGIYYTGTDMETRVNMGNVEPVNLEKRPRPTVRYGIYYDGLKGEAVIDIQR